MIFLQSLQIIRYFFIETPRRYSLRNGMIARYVYGDRARFIQDLTLRRVLLYYYVLIILSNKTEAVNRNQLPHWFKYGRKVNEKN